jgi:hypothetical protein
LWARAVLGLFPSPVRINGRLVLVGDGIKAPKRGKKMPAVKLLHQQSESPFILQGVEVVRSVGVEPTWLPATLSRWCVYRFRHERGYWRTYTVVVGTHVALGVTYQLDYDLFEDFEPIAKFRLAKRGSPRMQPAKSATCCHGCCHETIFGVLARINK